MLIFSLEFCPNQGCNIIQLQGLKKKRKINHSEINCLIAKMEQDLINAEDILSLEDHKEKVSFEPFILSLLPFTGLFIFFYSVMAGSQKKWKGEDWHINPLTCLPEKKKFASKSASLPWQPLELSHWKLTLKMTAYFSLPPLPHNVQGGKEKYS